MAKRLADLRCTEVDDEALEALVEATRLPTNTVEHRLAHAHGNTLVARALGDAWPTRPEQLRPFTVAAADRLELDVEIASAAGLTLRAVRNRITRRHGKMLVGNAFPELAIAESAVSEADDDDDDDDDDDGELSGVESEEERFSELLGAISVSAVRAFDSFVRWWSVQTGAEERAVARLFDKAHGRTKLRTLFSPERLPASAKASAAKMLRAAAVEDIRPHGELVRWVALVLDTDPVALAKRMDAADPRTTLGNLAGGRAADPRSASTTTARTSSGVARGGVRSATPGVLLDGKYQLGPVLGAGGFGKVFDARRVTPPISRVVVKFGQRLTQEIERAWSLTHQNICRYLDRGESDEYGEYLVLEFGGESLADRLNKRGRFTVEQALDVLRQAADGLDYAHRRDIPVLHQDIKPANILLESTRNGDAVRLADFGSALAGAAGQNTHGRSTVLAGSVEAFTRAYAAPEQLAGGKGRRASDQYSLALVMCSMLEGRVFDTRQDHWDFSELSSAQNAALRRALSHDPEARFGSCGEFARAMLRR